MGLHKPIEEAFAADEEYVFPLSYQQERLWFVAQFDPDNAAYHLPVAVRLRGPLDPAILHLAVRDLVARHETLRTRYERDVPVQVVVPDPDVRLLLVDGSCLSSGDRHDSTAADQWLRSAAVAVVRRPFDLWSAPPLRVALLRLGPADHVLVLVVHHIAADGWSVGVLLRELGNAYLARCSGTAAALPELPVQYGDYALWQRDQPTERSDSELSYWTEALAGAPAALELPTDHPRPPVATGTGGRVRRSLDADLVAQLDKLAAEYGATRFMVVLAGYAWVLSRMSGQDDVVVGTPVAGRARPELRSVIGCFIDVLPLRLDLSGDPSVAELLGRVRLASRSAFAHAELPFERLVERLQPERDLSRSPMFQVMLSFDSGTMPVLALPGLTAEPVRLDPGVAKYDLTVDVEPSSGGLAVDLEYRRDLFAPETARRVLERLEQILRSLAAAAPDAPASGLQVLGGHERRWLAAAGGGPPTAGNGRGSVLDEVCGRWSGRSGEVAVVDGYDGTTLAFQEVLSHAGRVSAALTRTAVRRGDLVGVLLPRSTALVPSVLGVWEAGAAYLPLDPDWPEERLRYLVDDAGVRVVLTTSALAEKGPVGDVESIVVDALAPEAAVVSRSVTGADAAYLLYTSGSTGRPKGVLVGHAAVANLLASIRDGAPGLSPADRWLAVTTLSFDISLLELIGPLAAGATVVVATAEQAADPHRLAGAIARFRPTVVQATATMWRMLVASGWRATGPLRAFVGGEPLATDLAERLLADGHEVWNLYGPTETTIWSTVGQIAHPKQVHVGRPVAGTSVRLLDAAGRPAPAGAIGEVYIGGTGLAYGYHGRPALTAERFLPDPDGQGDRLYRTGDLACWRPDRTLACYGRADQQYKIRGHRVELGEVEATLAGHPAVAAAVVAAHHPTPHDTQLVAYVQPAPEQRVDPAELASYLRRQLPASMVPTRFIPLDTFPRTPNGKLDRAGLPPPGAMTGLPDGTATSNEPADDLEEAVLGCFRRTLRSPGLGMAADFFQHGGSSLVAVELVTDLDRTVGVRLELRDVFRTPTPAAVAELVRQARQLPEGVAVGEVRPQVWSPRRVLVLGATSSVGSALVDQLLAVGIQVTCAVAARDETEARHRLDAAAARFGRPRSGDDIRVQAVDPRAELLSLADDRYAALATGLDAVYHVALPGYDGQLESALASAIRLAASGPGKALHHVRQLEPDLAVDGLIPERLSAAPDEAMMYQAATRGLPVTVFRVAPVLPADQVAELIAAVTRRPAADGRVFNLSRGDEPLVEAEAVATVLGHPSELEPLSIAYLHRMMSHRGDQWRKRAD